MPKKKDPPLSPEEQRKRFEALARKAGASASAGQFREAVGRIAKAKRGKEHKKNKE